MNFHIQINCDNAAFADSPGTELARILGELVPLVREFAEDTAWERSLYDCNGNKVGRAVYTKYKRLAN